MSKKNIYLASLLAVLVLLAIAYSGPFKEWKDSIAKPDNYFSDVNFDDIDRMLINKEGEEIVINKNDDRWLIEGTKDFYVPGRVMNSVIEAIESANESEFILISEASDKKSDFMTSKETGTELSLISGETKVLDVVIGKNGTEAGSSYVSRDGEDETYLVKATLNQAFTHDNWYDKQIFSVDKENINKVRFQYPSREFTIEKEESEDGEGTWQGVLPYIFSVDMEKVDEVLEVLASLEATEIPAQSFEGTGLEKNLIIVQFTGEDVDEVIMVGEANEEDQYYVKKGDSDNIYLIEAEEKDILEKRISDLR